MRETHPQDNFFSTQASVGFYVQIKFARLGHVVEWDIIARWFLFSGVGPKWPLCTLIRLVPVRCMPQLVIGIVFEANSSTRRPFGVLFGNALEVKDW